MNTTTSGSLWMPLRKNTVVHNDNFDKALEEAKNALEDYSIEELLELSDLPVEEAVAYLVVNGFLELPEIKSVR